MTPPNPTLEVHEQRIVKTTLVWRFHLRPGLNANETFNEFAAENYPAQMIELQEAGNRIMRVHVQDSPVDGFGLLTVIFEREIEND